MICSSNNISHIVAFYMTSYYEFYSMLSVNNSFWDAWIMIGKSRGPKETSLKWASQNIKWFLLNSLLYSWKFQHQFLRSIKSFFIKSNLIKNRYEIENSAWRKYQTLDLIKKTAKTAWYIVYNHLVCNFARGTNEPYL